MPNLLRLRSGRIAFVALLAVLSPALRADPTGVVIWGGLVSDLIGPDSYHPVPLSAPELVSLWSGAGDAKRSAHALTLPKNAFATLTALERIGGGAVTNALSFQVTKYSSRGTPVKFTLRMADFDQIGFWNAFIPEMAGPMDLRLDAAPDGSVTRADFKVREVITDLPQSAEYVELSCSKSENGGRSAELILGDGDIAYRRNLGAIGITNGRVAKAADTDFIINSFHLRNKGVHPEYVKRLRFSKVGIIGGTKPGQSFTTLRTDLAPDSERASGRASLQAFRGPCVITLEAVSGGPDWAFQQFYIHRGNGSRFLTDASGGEPRVIAHPESVDVKAGASVTFTVAAAGTPSPTYQWQFNGTAIPGATRPSLVINNVKNSDEGDYRVVIRNSAGSVVSQKAYLDVDNYRPAPQRP